MLEKAIESIKRHEGWRSKPYRDTLGYLSIGYGFCLDRIHMPREVGDLWLKILVSDLVEKLRQRISFFDQLDEARQVVLIDMAYNLGVPGLMKFKKMLSALEQKDYQKAAIEMLNSRWARQVKNRAVELAKIMKTGEMSYV